MKDVIIKKSNIVYRFNNFINKISPIDHNPNCSTDTCSFFWNTILKFIGTMAAYLLGYLLLTASGLAVMEKFVGDFELWDMLWLWLPGILAIAGILASAGALAFIFIGLFTVFKKGGDLVGTTSVITHMKDKTCARITFED